MDRLEQKIFDELDRFEKFSQYITKQDAARIAASVCLEVLEEGYFRGAEDSECVPIRFGRVTFEDFKKEIL